MDEINILLVDDDEELCALLTDYLGRDGYQVTSSGNGPDGLALARSGAHSLVLLDIMLPGLDGLEVVRELRKSSSVPVIMLTAKGEDVDRIVGLELGADDYLPKPFNPRELAARIKAVLRRAPEGASESAPGQGSGQDSGQGGAPGTVGGALSPAGRENVLRYGELSLDLNSYAASLAGRHLALTSVEFGLLRELMLARGRVLTRDTLLDRVRGKEFELFDRSIDVHISHLRQKLGDDAANPSFIRTVRSVGYLFIGEPEPGSKPRR